MVFRINPTIFDKLAASHDFRPSTEVGAERPERAESLYTTANIEGFSEGVLRVNLDSFGESALRANVRRELGWLLNTTNLKSVPAKKDKEGNRDPKLDLTKYPRVLTSVLNYGVDDLAGKAQSREAISTREGHIRNAIKAFEPRIDANTLSVEATSTTDRENAVTYVIAGNVTSAVGALHVQYYTDVEADTGNTRVRE
jgi:type VI secretion system protein ImpF